MLHRDKKILKNLLDRTMRGKSSIVTGIPGIGTQELYHDFIHQLDFKKLPYLFLTYEIIDSDSYNEFEKEIDELSNSLFVVIQYVWNKNFEVCLEKLGKVLNSRPHEFMFVIFSETIFPQILLYENVLLPIKPLYINDSKLFLDDISTRYQIKLTVKQKEQIINLAGGNCGLLVQLATNGEKNSHVNNILKTIHDSLGNTSQFLFSKQKTYQHFFQTFGIKSHNLVFSPLFEEYVKKQPILNHKELEKLSKLDQKILTLLEKKKGELVSQKELAELAKTHEVSISKLINNLTDKFPYLEIETVKGKGFILNY